jgi:lipase (class 2)
VNRVYAPGRPRDVAACPMTGGSGHGRLARVTAGAGPKPPPRRARARRSVAYAAAVIAALAVILAGCGGGSHRKPSAKSGTPTTPSRSGTGSSTTPGATPPSAPPPPTKLNSSCKPPPQHPYPVLLLSGTYGVSWWALIGPQLAQLGYCVYTLAYGNDATGDIIASAKQLGPRVDQVLASTGASRVSIVGHSEGGMMPRYYIKFLGGGSKVDQLVALAPPNHGTLNPATYAGAVTGCVACAQQETGSSFLAQLNAGDETPPPVNYTVIETRYDEVVVPYTSAFLNGPSARVTNVTLQAGCPRDLVGHIGITTDPIALQWVENALAGKGPANPSFVPSC